MKLFGLFLVAAICICLNGTVNGRGDNFKKYMKPCFVGDEIENMCSEPSESCHEKLGTELKLVRLDGVKTGHVQWMEVGDEQNSLPLITRAMTPLVFEIPEFLSAEECDHIISLAKNSGLQTSTSGFTTYDGDLDEDLAIADKDWTLTPEQSFAGKFEVWDTNGDGLVNVQEVRAFAGKHKQLYLTDDEVGEIVIKLTKLPRKIVQGGEPMQVVRYEKFGHYHGHLDSTIKGPTVPCCHQNYLRAYDCRVCRFITILYYLNDVEEGGQTAFLIADNTTTTPDEIENSKAATDEFNLSINCHSANLVIPPKKGTAIMWYNNFIDPNSGLLGPVDRYTMHGGCDVMKGEKWVANNWLTAPTKYSRHIKSMFDTGFD
ncbi:prolyl 4-hydroxylase [Desmophyllum pertusum]|uniref:Prolyl 4-hydroxylase n=1 Tax=Desmophyllum pertusum TaxID=174260 RepID=A0A9W9YNW1_9CNID|nr:prolyl 4-hydroxylase [Desmophyllum pertusum]